MQRYTHLIDTNIIIAYLADNPKAVAFLEQPLICAISDITMIEVLSYPYTDEESATVQAFLEENFVILPVTHQIVLQTAQNRRQKKTKTPDAIIGATALCHRLTIVTNNTKDFVHLPIAIINPLD